MSIVSRITTLAFSFVIPYSAIGANVVAGHEGANGGNYAAQEIARLSGELIEIIRSAPAIFPDVTIDQLQEAVAKTKLYLANPIVVNGRELDAQNDGNDTIWINVRRWEAAEHTARLALLFHEYLGIMHLESNTYQISSRLLNPLFDLNQFKEFHCSDRKNNYFGFYLKIRYDRMTDRFLIQYAGIDEASLAVRCEKFPGTLQECIKVWNPNGSMAREYFSDGFGGFRDVDNIVERRGTKITYDNGQSPPPGRYYWTDLLFHNDGSATFLGAQGWTKFCSPSTR